jgi:phosphopantothenoylcysteine synthetase/decarboxylase
MINRLLLGCTGSIGVLSVPHLILKLRMAFSTEIQVLMTKSAQNFLTPYALEIASGRSVATDIFGNLNCNHISLVTSYPAFLIAPATANIISKIANGIADDIVSLCACVCLGSTSKLILAPSMNPAMWNNPVVQENVRKLICNGVQLVGPSAGIKIANLNEVASAMADINEIIEKLSGIDDRTEIETEAS